MKHLSSEKQLIFILVLGIVAGFAGGILSRPILNYLHPTIHTVQNFVQNTTTPDIVLEQDEKNTIDVVQKSNPAVVSVVISKPVTQNSQGQDMFLRDLFGLGFPVERIPPPVQPKNSKDATSTPMQQVGAGSGFIVRSDGYIVTNKHVVADDTAVYTVKLSNEKEYPAKVIGVDPVLDVAVLKIEEKDLPILPLGNSDGIKIGQTVIAIGNALAEFGNTVTKGVVSGVGRRITAGDSFGQSEVLDHAIQTDAAINPGNSGGPLLNLSGEVVGINTAVSERGQLLGFAIPINSVKQIIQGVLDVGHIVHPWIGVRYVPVTPKLAEMNHLSVTSGALVLRGETEEDLAVVPGGPADIAGIVENDIILEVNGKKLEDKDSLAQEISKYKVGDEVTLHILHKGKEKDVKVKLTEFPTDKK